MAPKTLLLVEDSFTIQKLVESTFKSAGYQVAIANHAREGIASLPIVSPDIVLADASMPEMDGFQLCEVIRSTQGFERIPVLLLTSRFAAYDETQGQRSGVTAYLAKPFDSYSLLALVQQLIDNPPLGIGDSSPSATTDDQTEQHALASPTNSEPTRHHEPSTLSAAFMPPAYTDLTTALSHIVQETVQSYLVTLLDSLTPHIVEGMRATFEAKAPELLESLLQREIEKLKQAAAQDEALHEERL